MDDLTQNQLPNHSATGNRIDPQAMTVEDAARMMTAAGGRKITAATVQAAIDAGAPVLADGRVNLVELMAWMERELAT